MIMPSPAEMYRLRREIVAKECYIQQYQEGGPIMKHANHRWFTRVQCLVLILLLSVGLSLTSGTVMAQEAKVTPLMSKDLKDFPGKELLMITAEHVPGGSNPSHRHNAHAMLYVLEGSVMMQVKGGKEVTLTPGQTFYEGPDDIHVVDRNASK